MEETRGLMFGNREQQRVVLGSPTKKIEEEVEIKKSPKTKRRF